MTARRIRVVGVLALALLASFWGGPAGAEDITGKVERVGWWSSRLGAQPTVEPASFEVSYGTDGEPTSVAALDISVPVQPVQLLQISMTEVAGTANGVGHLQVCLADPGWETANAGELEAAPRFDCSNPADLTRSLDGNWLGDIGALVPDGGTASLGVKVVDDLGLPVSLGATVQISEITITGQSADGGATTDTTPTTVAPPPPPDPSIVEPSPDFAPPPAPAFDAPPLEGPAAEQPTTPTTVEVAAPPPPLLPASFDSEGKPWLRILFLAPLAAGMGLATVYARRYLEARGVSFS